MGMVEKISSLFNVSKSYLLGEVEEVEMPNINTQFKVPYYGQVSAGNFETVEIDTKELEVPDIAFNGRNLKNVLLCK